MIRVYEPIGQIYGVTSNIQVLVVGLFLLPCSEL